MLGQLGALLLALTQFAYAGRMDDSGYPSGGSDSMVLMLGMLHALPMLGLAATTKSKALTTLTAMGMAVVAFTVGGARYAYLDLIFVALGTWGALRLCTNK